MALAFIPQSIARQTFHLLEKMPPNDTRLATVFSKGINFKHTTALVKCVLR